MKKVYMNEFLEGFGISKIVDYGREVEYDDIRANRILSHYMGQYEIWYTDGVHAWGDNREWLDRLIKQIEEWEKEKYE